MTETFRRFYAQTRDGTGLIARTKKNASLLYHTTKNLTRQANRPHHFSPEFIFAQEFTDHYDEFAIYFPEFGRLRELSKVTVLIRVLRNLRDNNQDFQKRLQVRLDDQVSWQGRNDEIRRAIADLKSQYSKALSARQVELNTTIKADFVRWRAATDERCHAVRAQLSDILRQMGSLVVAPHSAEVNAHYQKHIPWAERFTIPCMVQENRMSPWTLPISQQPMQRQMLFRQVKGVLAS